jgi:nitrate reductase gamma subunit
MALGITLFLIAWKIEDRHIGTMSGLYFLIISLATLTSNNIIDNYISGSSSVNDLIFLILGSTAFFLGAYITIRGGYEFFDTRNWYEQE